MWEFAEVRGQSFRISSLYKKQKNNLCEYISDMQTGEDKNIKDKRKQAGLQLVCFRFKEGLKGAWKRRKYPG